MSPDLSMHDASYSYIRALWEVMFKYKGRLSGIFSFLISAGLITFLITRMDFSKAALLLRQAQWRWLILAACLAGLIPFTGTCRWLGILRAHRNFKFPITQAWKAVMCSFVLNVFLPSKAGDLSKAFYVRKYGGISLGVGSVILERLADLWMLGLIAIAGGTVSSTPWGVIVGIILMGGSVSIFGAISQFKELRLPVPYNWQSKALEWSQLCRRWARDPNAVSMTLIGSLGTWCLAGLIVCSLATSLRSETEWAHLLAIFPLAIMAGLIPVTISGIGTRDSAFVFMMTGRLTAEGATMVSLGYTILAYWLVGLIGLPIFLQQIGAFTKSNHFLTNDAKD